MKLKLKSFSLSNRSRISNMQRISKLSKRELKLIPRKLLLKRKLMNRKKNYSKLTKQKSEPESRVKLNNRELELKNLRKILKLQRKKLSKWLQRKPNLPNLNSRSNVKLP